MECSEWRAWAPFLDLSEHLTNSLHVEQEAEFDCAGADAASSDVIDRMLNVSEERRAYRESDKELTETCDSCLVVTSDATTVPVVREARVSGSNVVKGLDGTLPLDPEGAQNNFVSGQGDSHFRGAQSIEAGLALDGLAELLSMTRHTVPAVWRVK